MNNLAFIKTLTISGLVVFYLIGCGYLQDSFTDPRDGQTYKTVNLGTQTWLAENLNYEMQGSWCYADSASYGDKYGRLYTWEAAKIASPPGWHLPSNEEWKTLERYLGMTVEETNIFHLRGEGMGTKLKSEKGWETKNGRKLGYNESGFNALPGGYRLWDGTYHEIGRRGSWWTSTPENQYGLRRGLFLNDSRIDIDAATVSLGFSVRCVKDE